ncbi:MAG TPA: thioredoxin family protein [Phycisphaerales bacterium]|nr:thioredoxin family protein [Phycisphaerales bacterium]HMP38130.1 thioredoxin family protein [Phycisphaerales bacterium]
MNAGSCARLALSAPFLESKFASASDYASYIATDPAREGNWRAVERTIELTPAQRDVVAAFVRPMPVLVVSGTWCGDCVQQGPMLHRIAQASPAIDLRWLDRDEHLDLAESVRICGGLRVPTVIFMAEDFEFVHLLGDRTLSRYRAIAGRTLGASCPVPGAALPADESAETLQDWVNEFERVALLLLLSPRLRERHGE